MSNFLKLFIIEYSTQLFTVLLVLAGVGLFYTFRAILRRSSDRPEVAAPVVAVPDVELPLVADLSSHLGSLEERLSFMESLLEGSMRKRADIDVDYRLFDSPGARPGNGV